MLRPKRKRPAARSIVEANRDKAKRWLQQLLAEGARVASCDKKQKNIRTGLP
jgi:hypothetical protein